MSDSILSGLMGRVRLMVARVVVGLVDDGKKLQAMQVTTYGDLTRDQAEHFQHYGFTSVPLPGAEGIGLSVGGSTNHMCVINVDDRRFRMKDLGDGEVAIYDHLGQSAHLTKDGIVVKGAGLPMIFEDTPSITFKADSFIRFETPRVEATQLIASMQYTMGGVAGGSGALVATFSGGTMNYNNVTRNMLNCTTTATSGSFTHDGKNVGSTHTHGNVQSGGDNSGPPNP